MFFHVCTSAEACVLLIQYVFVYIVAHIVLAYDYW